MADRIRQLEAQLAATPSGRRRIDLLNDLAWALREHNPQRSLTLCQTAYELTRTGQFAEQPYRQGMAKSLHNLSLLNAQLTNYDLALSQAFEALALFEFIGDLEAQKQAVWTIRDIYRWVDNERQRQRQMAESLREVATVLNSSLNLETVLGKIVEQLGRVVQYVSAAVFLRVDDDLVISNGANLSMVDIGYRVPLDSLDPVVRVFKNKQALIIDDVQMETGWQKWREGDRVHSWIGTPLLTGWESIGVLTVDHANHNAYRSADAEILQTFADQSALAIRNARQVQRAKAAVHETGLLYRVGSILAKTSDIRAGVEKALGEYLWALNLKQGGVALFDTNGRGRELRALYLNGEAQPAGLRLEDYSQAHHQVVETGRPLAITDALNDPLLANSQEIIKTYNIKSMLLAPLIVRGKVIGLLGADATDKPRQFTEREKDLAQAIADQIATAVERARLLQQEQEQRRLAESQNKELDAFGRTVAHDIKNPLGTIVAYSDFLFNHLSAIEQESAMEMIKTIRQSAHKGANIVDELLLLAGVRKQKVTREPLDMDLIVEQAEQRLSFMIDEYKGQLIFPKTWPIARGYAPWIEEVWVNYISNGLKYGGQPPRLELGARSLAERMICFWIQDNGPGLTPEAQVSLFAEFTRLEEVRAKGHGLGLSIVRRIVEKLGGQVGVQSDGLPGQGSLFYFTLQADDGCLPGEAA